MEASELKLYHNRLVVRPVGTVSSPAVPFRMERPGGDLGRATAAGMVWLLMQTLGGRVVGFLSQLVVAAILDPRDFGVLGLTFTVTALGAMLVNSGIESVLLQRHGSIRLWIVPAVWSTVALGLLGAALVAIAGPVAALLYHSPGIPLLALIVGLSMPLTAAGTVPMVLLRARFAFAQIATINFFEIVGIQGVTILMAYCGCGALSFVVPLPLVAALRTFYLWRRTRPKWRGGWRQIRRARYLVGRSAAVFATAILQAAISQGDYIALGLWASESAVGLYFFALKMASQPLLLMASSLTNVLFPTLSTLRNVPQQQGQAALRAAKILGLAIMPAAFLQAGLIGPAIHLFFPNHKWDDSVLLMQILSVGLGFNATALIAATLLTSRGGFREQLRYTAMCVPVFFLFALLGAWNGLAVGVASGVAAYYMLVTPVYSHLVFRRYGVRFRSLAWLYLMPSGLATAAVGGALLIADLAHVTDNVARIVGVTIVAGPAYLLLLRLVDRRGFGEIELLVRRMLKRPAKLAA